MNMSTLSFNDLLIVIGSNLNRLRYEKNEKIETVAKAIGVHHSVVSKIENGRYNGLNVKMLQKLAKYYQEDITNILY